MWLGNSQRNTYTMHHIIGLSRQTSITLGGLFDCLGGAETCIGIPYTALRHFKPTLIGWLLGCKMQVPQVSRVSKTSIWGMENVRGSRPPRRPLAGQPTWVTYFDPLYTKYLPIQHGNGIHPGKLTWNTIMEVDGRWFSFSKRWFLGWGR